MVKGELTKTSLFKPKSKSIMSGIFALGKAIKKKRAKKKGRK